MPLEQQAQSPSVHAGIVAGDGKIACTGVAQRKNQRLGNSTQAEPADGQQHAVAHHAVKRLVCIRP